VVSFRQVSPPKSCIRLSSHPYMLRAPPISLFSILSPEQYWVMIQIIKLQRVFTVNIHKTMFTYGEGEIICHGMRQDKISDIFRKNRLENEMSELLKRERSHFRVNLSRSARFLLLAAWRGQDYSLLLSVAQQTVLTSIRLSCKRADRSLTINSATIAHFNDLNRRARLMNVASAR
jgi:hypothetical protein